MDPSDQPLVDDTQAPKAKREKRVRKPHTEAQALAHKNNGWIAHLSEYKAANPGLAPREYMKAASPSWQEKKNAALKHEEE